MSLIDKAKEIKEKTINEDFHIFMNQPLYFRYNTDNTILFTIEFYALLHDLGLFDEKDAKRLKAAIYWLHRRKSGGLGLDLVSGLFNRNPGRDDRKDQHDNYCAISCSSMFGKDFQKYAQQIDDYGQQVNSLVYSFDNRIPFKFSINPFWKPLLKLQFREAFKYFECARMGWNVFIYKVCANRWPFGITGINYLWWALGTIFLPEGTSTILLHYLRFKAMKHKWYVKPFYKLWRKKVNRRYEGGLAEAFGIYHGVNSPLYKLAKITHDLGIN